MAAVHLLLGTVLLAVNSVAQTPGDDLEQLAQKNADFGTSLYRRVASTTDGNVVVSPLSMTLGLAALAEGAAGQSREQLLRTLQLGGMQKADDPDSLPQLLQTLEDEVEKGFAMKYDQATALFAAQQVQLETAFQDRVKKFFQAEAQNVDFSKAQAAMSTINDYFRSKTGDKIREVLSSAMDATTQLMLVNAVSFKGEWRQRSNLEANMHS